MASVINKNTLEYLTSVNSPNYSTDNWVHNPDISAVTGVPWKYWKLNGSIVEEMNVSEKAAKDAELKTIADAKTVARVDNLEITAQESSEALIDLNVVTDKNFKDQIKSNLGV